MKISSSPVREQLLKEAQALIRRVGYNGFSYRDLADVVGVKTSSIHYYFPSKDDLVLEAVSQYSASVADALRAIDRSLPAEVQARQYLASLRACDSDQICMVGMLSTETLSLPESVHKILRAFYRMNETWLGELLEKAAVERARPLPAAPGALAQILFGALQHGLVASRVNGTSDRIDAVSDMLIASASA